MTAMIEFGALIGAINQGSIADKISSKYSIFVAVLVFIIGSVLQRAAVDLSHASCGPIDRGYLNWNAQYGSAAIYLRDLTT